MDNYGFFTRGKHQYKKQGPTHMLSPKNNNAIERRTGTDQLNYHHKKKHSLNDIYSKHKKIFLTDNLEKILKENYLKSKNGNTSSNMDNLMTAESIHRLDNDLD